MSAPRVVTHGFGVPDVVDPHHFVVDVPATSKGEIEVREVFGVRDAASSGVDEIVRIRLPRARWTLLSKDLKRHFNERLRGQSMKASDFKAGPNLVNRVLGREMCVLLWAVERADDPGAVGRAVLNWLGFSPGERAWLFSYTAATAGGSGDAEGGWRKALFFALTEEPEAIAKAGRERRRRPEDENQLSLI